MAVTGTFQADFSSFLAAIDKADVGLVDLSKGAGKVETSLNRMVDNFSGRKLIQEASLMTIAVEKAGGIATLTARELEVVGNKAAEAADKMQRLGYEVPAGMQRLADAAKQAEQPTSLLTTGLGKLAGIFTLAKVVEFGADLFATASRLQDMTERTDVSVEALQRFAVIAEQSGSSLDAVSTAVFQMGKRLAGGDANAADAVKVLGLNFDELRASQPEQAFEVIGRALADLDDPMKRDALSAAIFGRSVAELIPVFKHLQEETGPYLTMSREQVGLLDDLGDAYVRAKASIVPTIVAWADEKFQLSLLAQNIHLVFGELEKAPPIHGDAKAAADAVGASWAAMTPHAKSLAEAMALDRDVGKDLTESIKEQIAVTTKWKALLEEMDKTTFHLAMDHQKQWREEIEKTKTAINQSVVEGLAQTQKAQKDLSDFIAKNTLSSADYQIVKIWEVVAEEEKAFKGTEQQRVQFNAVVEALANEQTEMLKKKAREAADAEKQAALDTFNAWVAAIAPIGHGPETPNAGSTLNPKPLTTSPLGGSFSFQAGGATDPAVLGLMASGYTLGEAMAIIGGYGARIGLPHPRALGGPVSAGSPYLVGEHGPELFVPSNSGSILPNSSGAGGPHVIQILLDGRVIAEVVNQHNTKHMGQDRQWPAS